MAKLQRTQILLEAEQHKALGQYAEADGSSISALVREAVTEYLVEREQAAQKTAARLALEALEAIRDTVKTDQDLTRLLADAREERANELPVGWESLT